MKGIIDFVIELSVIMAFGTVGFNHLYHDTKMATLKKVSEGTVSLTRLTSSYLCTLEGPKYNGSVVEVNNLFKMKQVQQ